MIKKYVDISYLKWRIVGWLGKVIIDLIGGTMQLRVEGVERVREQILSRRFILAFWHSRIVLVSYTFTGWGGTALVSKSKDGEIIAQILHRQGHEAIRGSTSKHAARSLAQMIRRLKQKQCPGAMIPDGPRGPRFKVQPGIIALAQKTGYPIIPVSYSAKKLKVFNSWDRFVLPRPWTEGYLCYGHPLLVPYTLNSQSREALRKQLEKELNRITTMADGVFNHCIV